MTTFVINIVQSVFKPSVVALSLSMAVAIVSFDGNKTHASHDTISLSSLGCSGLLSPICRAF